MDDLRASVASWSDLKIYAEGQGRWIFMSLMGIIPQLVHSVHSLALIKILLIAGVVSNLLAFSYLATRAFSNRQVFWLIFVMGLLLIPDNWEHSQVSAGPLVGTLPLTLYALSLLFFFDSLHTDGASKKLVWSISFYALCLQFGEAFVTLSAAYYIIAWFSPGGRTIRVTFLRTRWITLTTVIFLISYFTYRYFHPSGYVGNKVSWEDFSIRDFLFAFWQYSVGSAPFVSFQSGYMQDYLPFSSSFESERASQLLPFLFRHSKELSPVWFVQGIIGVYVLHIFSKRMRVKKEVVILWILVLLIVIFGSNILVALTKHYQNWAKIGVKRYVGSYYSYFGWVLLAVLLYSFFMEKIRQTNFRRFYQFVGTVILFAAIFLNSMASDSVRASKIAVQSRAQLMDQLMSHPVFQKLPENSVVFSPDILTAQIMIEVPPNDYWDRLISIRHRKKVHVTANWSECAASLTQNTKNPVFHVSLRTEPGRGTRFLIFAEIRKIIPKITTIDNQETTSTVTDYAVIFSLAEKFPRSILYQSSKGLHKVSWPAGDNWMELRGSNIAIESIHPTRKTITLFDKNDLRAQISARGI